MSALPLGLPEPLFGGPSPRLRHVPASAPFLETLADAMARELRRKDDPFALSDALVLLPNRRGARGLIDAFAERLGGAALLPTIRPLGDPHADDDPDVWGADPITVDLPRPIEPLKRRLLLASLVRRRSEAETGVDDPVRALALADELARLLDSAASVDEVAWERLPRLVEEFELARHWARSAEFLQIVTTFWPEVLKEAELSDPGAHGARLRRLLAARWAEDPPKRAIVIAGSTGSLASTRALMRVVARLPRGCVVFPGLDVDLDEGAWSLVGDQHPQFALKGTLAALGVSRSAVAPLANENAEGRARRVLIREALAPAEKTADWLVRLAAAGGAAFVSAGARGMQTLEAATENEEATAIALILREAVEQGRSAAVVTPDASLARRIESKLARWRIEPSVSHGLPLQETHAGRLIALLCELASDLGNPIALAALVKHPGVRISRDASALAQFEHKGLRGPRRYRSLGQLQGLLSDRPGAAGIVASLAQALAPIQNVMNSTEAALAQFCEAIVDSAERLCGDAAWTGRDGDRAAGLLRETIEQGAPLGFVPVRTLPRLVQSLMAGREVPPEQGGDDRVVIWGMLEARLQRRDLMILAGLNEGVWPAPAPEDPFLSRPMRAALGLPALDQRIGLAAHDFAQLANAPRVVLTRSLRRDGAPTLASRWLWRLRTLLQGAGAHLESGAHYLEWARALDKPHAVEPAKAPRPCPPADKRLKRINVTGVETLIRDPYAIYARRLLQLEHLKPIGAVAGPAERGTAMHRAIERFGDGEDAELLLRLLDEELMRAGVPAERRAADRERLRVSALALVHWFRSRGAVEVFREVRGKLELDGLQMTLTGAADRIEIGAGGAVILDFKTGEPPSDKQVASGLSPQLPLEAAMLARGAFEGVPTAKTNELIYWRFGGADPAPRPVKLDDGAHAAGEEALASLRSLLERYADPAQPFLSKPRVQFLKPYAEYDLLARRKEWADAEGET
jgi:ATP-dependent helicase/nuclease subunit B